MKTFLSILSMLALIQLGLSFTSPVFAEEHGEHEHGAKGNSVTLKGEVVDLHCYLLHPDSGKGAEHAKCATSCINKGLPAGFLSGDQVYLLLGPGHDSAKKLVAEHAGHPVTLVGKPIDHHGIKAIQVEKVEAGKGHAHKEGHKD